MNDRVAYMQNCRTFSDAMNNLRFEVRLPEYYNSQIPYFFKRPIKGPKPIVNGEEVEWSEFLETHQGEEPDTVIPQPFYQSEEMNLNIAYITSAEFLEVVDNGVYVEIPNFHDLNTILAIMEGYYNEIKSYIDLSADLKKFIEKFNRVYFKLDKLFEEITNYSRNTAPEELRGPITLADILESMGV